MGGSTLVGKYACLFAASSLQNEVGNDLLEMGIGLHVITFGEEQMGCQKVEVHLAAR
jgi:hypothetical protein